VTQGGGYRQPASATLRVDRWGETFTNISGNLPDIPVNDIVRVGGKLVVATDIGVYVRSAGSWSVYGTGLPNVSVLDLALQPGGDQLMTATHGRAVWLLNAS